jgi:hypothetical protein
MKKNHLITELWKTLKQGEEEYQTANEKYRKIQA